VFVAGHYVQAGQRNDRKEGAPRRLFEVRAITAAVGPLSYCTHRITPDDCAGL
jgi:hypothetical protein